jgi:hypothetical protein
MEAVVIMEVAAITEAEAITEAVVIVGVAAIMAIMEGTAGIMGRTALAVVTMAASGTVRDDIGTAVVGGPTVSGGAGCDLQSDTFGFAGENRSSFLRSVSWLHIVTSFV